jgi:hypothetical protein
MNTLEKISKANFSLIAVREENCWFINNFTYDSKLARINCQKQNFSGLNIPKTIDGLYDRAAEPQNRFGFVYSPIELKIALNRNYKLGLTSLSMADKDLSTYHVAFHSTLELKKIIRSKASQLLESGIFNFLYKNAHYPRDFTSKPEVIGPQVLTVTHLKAGFVIFCVLLFVSVTAFIIECAPKVSKKLFNLCLSCYIVVKFTKMNKML